MRTTPCAVRFAASCLLLAAIAGCSSKQQSATTDSSAIGAPKTVQVDTLVPRRSPGGPQSMLSGDITKDMQMMGSMMMARLGGPANNYDDRFIQVMIPHHEGAVMMANDALAKTTHPELKQLAQSIIAAQNGEIDKMKAWEKSWYGHDVPPDMAMQKMNAAMIQELGVDSAYDRRFLDAMIPHHESAIAMAKDALTKAIHPKLKTLAQNIISSQQKEIDQMNAWRSRWYGQ